MIVVVCWFVGWLDGLLVVSVVVGWSSLFVAVCLLLSRGVCCSLVVVCCLMFVVCCLIVLVVRCVLFVVSCSMFVMC